MKTLVSSCIILVIIHLSIASGFGEDIVQFTPIFRGRELPYTKIGNRVIEVTLSHEEFPVDLGCSSNQPIKWRRVGLDLETGSRLFDPNSIRIRRGVTKSKSGDAGGSIGYNYVSNLTLVEWSKGLVGQFRCESITPGENLDINIFLLPKDETSSNFLEPGSSQKVVPLVGTKDIVVPCRLSAFTNDIVVEKVGSWSNWKIDLEFSPSRNGFLIPTSGSYTDLKKYVANYRCSQIGFDESVSVQVEIKEPVDYNVFPSSGELMVVNALSQITLKCGSQVPINLVGAKNKEMNVTYSFWPKNGKFAYQAELTYRTGLEDQGSFRCETQNKVVLHTWEYKSLDYELSLQINEDGKQLRCATSNGKIDADVQLRIFSCGTEDECQMHLDSAKNGYGANVKSNNSKNILLTECGDGCKAANIFKAGGCLAICESSGGMHSAEIFFVDLDLTIHPAGNILSAESVARVSEAEDSESSAVFICTWSMFYLGGNVLWEVDESVESIGDINDMAVLDPSGGTLKSKVVIPRTSEQRRVKCAVPVWNVDIMFPKKRLVELHDMIQPLDKPSNVLDSRGQAEGQDAEVSGSLAEKTADYERKILQLSIANTFLLGLMVLLVVTYFIKTSGPTQSPIPHPVGVGIGNDVEPEPENQFQSQPVNNHNYIRLPTSQNPSPLDLQLQLQAIPTTTTNMYDIPTCHIGSGNHPGNSWNFPPLPFNPTFGDFGVEANSNPNSSFVTSGSKNRNKGNTLLKRLENRTRAKSSPTPNNNNVIRRSQRSTPQKSIDQNMQNEDIHEIPHSQSELVLNGEIVVQNDRDRGKKRPSPPTAAASSSKLQRMEEELEINLELEDRGSPEKEDPIVPDARENSDSVKRVRLKKKVLSDKTF